MGRKWHNGSPLRTGTAIAVLHQQRRSSLLVSLISIGHTRMTVGIVFLSRLASQACSSFQVALMSQSAGVTWPDSLGLDGWLAFHFFGVQPHARHFIMLWSVISLCKRIARTDSAISVGDFPCSGDSIELSKAHAAYRKQISPRQFHGYFDHTASDQCPTYGRPFRPAGTQGNT